MVGKGESMNIHEKLMSIQSRLKAPKNQYNSFGKYYYRSLEDISEALKPLLADVKATMTVSDEPVIIGDRVYIKATATITDTEDPTQTIINTAYAREPATKKGMDDSQITGATSSYARKYCLNGLFCIDDNKDADSMPPVATITSAQANEISSLVDRTGADLEAFLKYAQADTVENIQSSKYGPLKSMLLAKESKVAK
jgi:hypothetical protein